MLRENLFPPDKDNVHLVDNQEYLSQFVIVISKIEIFLDYFSLKERHESRYRRMSDTKIRRRHSMRNQENK